jgi:diguanylate cyclase (GGDEF)-like protein
MAFFGYAAAEPDERMLRLAPQVAAQLGRAVERWAAASAVHEAHARLEAAIGNMAQGLSLFDAERRLLLVNRRYRDMYVLADADAAQGMAASALFAQHAPLFDDEDAAATLTQLLDEAGEDRPSSAELSLRDGRVVAIRVTRTPAGGWVSTHLDVSDQHRAKARIAHLALHDALTGLPNRTKLRTRLNDELAAQRRSGGQVGVLCFDLDRFKAVNDTLGHPFGDLLLQRVAQRLTGSVRETDLVSRLGGDEFAIIQPASTQPGDARALAERIIAELALPFDLDGHLVSVGASVGIAVAPDDAGDAELLLKNADLALYRAKSDGRGTYRFFEPEMDARMQARRALELDLRRAVSLGEFDVYYQPTVNLATRVVVGFEALVRWNHPTRGLVPPSEFIPLAEEIGLIVPLGEFVLRRACADAALWPGEVSVAVNLSPVQFAGAGPVPAVRAALAAAGLTPSRLELEITESTMLADTETTLAHLHALKELGVRIAMDDFGTGYSSLSYLRKFPFDRVKIDRSFVTALHEKSGDAIMQAITALCEALGMETTAEGVETPAQLDYLAYGPCTDVQGYLFSPPRPASAVAGLIEALKGNAAPVLETALGGAVSWPPAAGVRTGR